MKRKQEFEGMPLFVFRELNAHMAQYLPDEVWQMHCKALRVFAAEDPEKRVAIMEQLISEGEALRADLPFKWSIDKPVGPVQRRTFSMN